jgi:hypothetical protein
MVFPRERIVHQRKWKIVQSSLNDPVFIIGWTRANCIENKTPTKNLKIKHWNKNVLKIIKI